MVTLEAFVYRDAFDLELASALFAGYVAVRPLEASERAAYRVEGALGCLRFATTRITDFLMRTPEGETPAATTGASSIACGQSRPARSIRSFSAEPRARGPCWIVASRFYP